MKHHREINIINVEKICLKRDMVAIYSKFFIDKYLLLVGNFFTVYKNCLHCVYFIIIKNLNYLFKKKIYSTNFFFKISLNFNNCK